MPSDQIHQRIVLSNKTDEDEIVGLNISEKSVKSGNTVDIKKNESLGSKGLEAVSENNDLNYSGLIDDDGQISNSTDNNSYFSIIIDQNTNNHPFNECQSVLVKLRIPKD